MNVGRLIGGIVCLVLAVVIAVLAIISPDKVIFMIGNTNVPFIPAIALGIVGIVLVATAVGGRQAAAAEEKPAVVTDPAKAALNKRLETIAWGLFLIMLGGFALVPRNLVDSGLWSIGVGVIMLGLNVARYAYGIKMSGFTTLLGILSLLGGIAELLGFVSLEGAFLLIILGAYLILKPWFEQRKLFGKAEES